MRSGESYMDEDEEEEAMVIAAIGIGGMMDVISRNRNRNRRLAVKETKGIVEVFIRPGKCHHSSSVLSPLKSFRFPRPHLELHECLQ
jgi:hypothetical protein